MASISKYWILVLLIKKFDSSNSLISLFETPVFDFKQNPLERKSVDLENIKRSFKCSRAKQQLNNTFKIIMMQLSLLAVLVGCATAVEPFHRGFGYVNFEEFGMRVPDGAEARGMNREYAIGERPEVVNWVERGAVTNVKDQGMCGSCWSYSATGVIEGAYFLKYGKLRGFSEQQLVACGEKNDPDSMEEYGGCNGYWTIKALDEIKNYGGLCADTGYGYEVKTWMGDNNADCALSNVVAHDEANNRTITLGDYCNTFNKGNRALPKRIIRIGMSADAIMKALNEYGPLSVSVNANTWSLYQRGVFTADECPAGRFNNHAVLLVGYGIDPETEAPYWLIKNSWGPKWGEDGFIRIARESEDWNGVCGISRDVVAVVL